MDENKRAKLVQGENKKNARDTDKKYGGTADGTTGPVENILLQFGVLQGIVLRALWEGT